MEKLDPCQELPECCGFVYQYAKAMQRQLNDGEAVELPPCPCLVVGTSRSVKSPCPSLSCRKISEENNKHDAHTHTYMFFPGSIAKGSSSKSGCQLHLPTSHANLSRVTSPASFSCQLFESYFTCQLLMSTFRLLSHSTKGTS